MFDNPTALRALMDGATVEYAKSQIIRPPEWRKRLEEIEAFLKTEIPIAEVFTQDDINMMNRIKNLIETIVNRISVTPSN